MVMTEGTGIDYLKDSLKLQLEIVRSKIKHLELIENSIMEAEKVIEKGEPHWNNIVEIIHVTNMEKDISLQYKDSRNLKVRINLHDRFSVNKYGWFNWIFDKINLSQN